MAIDLNSTGEQRIGTSKTIPPKSKVMVQLAINYPQPQNQGQCAPEFTRSNGNLEYLSTVLTVLSPSFDGKKIFANFNLGGAQTAGEHQAIDISMRFVRAIVEAARGISPHDNSPQASQGRIIQSWRDLDNMTFFIEVGFEEGKPNRDGKTYMNNRMERVVTIDDPDYAELYQMREKISDLPIPELTGDSAIPKQTTQQTAWGAAPTPPAKAQTPPPAAATTPAQSAAPAWAQKPAATQPTPPPPVTYQCPF